MASGDFFLADEISLADDSVLERLNSLLEAEKTIFLAEKGSTFFSATSIHVSYDIPSRTECGTYFERFHTELDYSRRGRIFHGSQWLLVRRDDESRR